VSRSHTFVALLRGINVGKAKRVSMEDLRAVLAGLGHSDVRTLLNSGNVVFSSASALPKDAASRVQKAVAEKTGVSSRVTIVSAEALSAIVEECPLGKVATNPSLLVVWVPASPSDLERVRPFLKRKWAPEAFAVGSLAAYVWCPGGSIESPLANAVARELGDAVTARNIATMTKLLQLARA